MSKNYLKSHKHQKNAKKCKIKFSCSDSHANETHLWPGEHLLKSFKKKNAKYINFRALIIIILGTLETHTHMKREKNYSNNVIV
jgi:hypothetical protein